MKKIILITILMFLLLPVLSFANGGDLDSEHHGMMNMGTGWNWFGWVWMVLVLIAVVVGIIALVKYIIK